MQTDMTLRVVDSLDSLEWCMAAAKNLGIRLVLIDSTGQFICVERGFFTPMVAVLVVRRMVDGMWSLEEEVNAETFVADMPEVFVPVVRVTRLGITVKVVELERRDKGVRYLTSGSAISLGVGTSMIGLSAGARELVIGDQGSIPMEDLSWDADHLVDYEGRHCVELRR